MIRELKSGQPRSRGQKRKDTFQFYKAQQWNNKRRCRQWPQDDDEDEEDDQDYNDQWQNWDDWTDDWADWRDDAAVTG